MSLIGHWPLIANSKDYTIHRNNGIDTDVTYGNGKIGDAAIYDGSTAYTLVNGNNRYDTLDSSLSISAWVYPVALGPTNIICARRNGCNNPGTWNMFFSSSGIVYLSFYTSPTNTTIRSVGNGLVPLNTWTHVLWTKTWGEVSAALYINGVSIPISGDTTVNGSTSSNRPITFGAQWSGDICATVPVLDSHMRNYTSIRVNDIRVYDHILSRKEINELNYGLVSQYSFDRDETDMIFDNSPYRKHITIDSRKPLWSPDTAIGSGSYAFDGGNYGIHIPYGPVRGISFWLKKAPNSGSAWKYLMDIRPGISNGYFSYATSGGIGADWNKIYINGELQPLLWSSLPDDQWFHFYAELDNLSYSDIHIMERYSNAEELIGSISEVKIYSTPLPDHKIKQLATTKAQLDTDGNLWSAEFIEDYTIADNLTITQLFDSNLFTYNQTPFNSIPPLLSDQSGTQFLYNITTGSLNFNWTYSGTAYHKFQNSDVYYTYIESQHDSEIFSTYMVVLPDSSRPERFTPNAIIQPGGFHSAIFSHAYDDYSISLVEGPVGDIKMKYWCVINLTTFFGLDIPNKSDLDTWFKDYINTRVNKSGQFITQEFEEEYIDNYEVVAGVTLTDLFDDSNDVHNNTFDQDLYTDPTTGYGWYAYATSVTRDSELNALKIYNPTYSSMYPGFNYHKNNRFINGEKYYVGFKYRTDPNVVTFRYNFANTAGLPSTSDLHYPPVSTTWKETYHIFTISDDTRTGEDVMHLRISYPNDEQSQVGNAYVNDVFIINLSTRFSPGTEPSEAQMRIWYLDYIRYTKHKMKIYKNKIEIIGNLQEGV